jgi:hypothetical protein
VGTDTKSISTIALPLLFGNISRLFPQLPLARNDFLSSNFFGSANQDEGLGNAYAFFFFSVGNRHTIATHNLRGHAQMKKRIVRVTIMFCSIVLAGVAFAANARAECSRETLRTEP